MYDFLIALGGVFVLGLTVFGLHVRDTIKGSDSEEYDPETDLDFELGYDGHGDEYDRY